jgi:hypothetical protein
VTSRRVLTWTFGLRTPFNPMSDAADGGDATSTGREGLQQVRLAKSLPNETGRFECFRIRAARSFVTITPFLHVDYESPERGGVCWALADSMCRNQLTRSSNTVGGPTTIRTRVLKCAPAGRCGSSVQFFAGHGPAPCAMAGHVVAAFGRHSSRPKCGGRRDGCPMNRSRRGAQRRLLVGLRGAEFVSEFETKRDQ